MRFLRLDKKKGSGAPSIGSRYAYLIAVSDVEYFPLADEKGVRLEGDIVLKENCAMLPIYLTNSSQEFSYETLGDDDEKSYKVKFIGTHPGTELEAMEFAKNQIEQPYLVLIPSCKEDEPWKLLGEIINPLIFTSSHKASKEGAKFTFNFEQRIGSEFIYFSYGGVVTAPEIPGPFIPPSNAFDPTKWARVDASNIDTQIWRDKLGILGGGVLDFPTFADFPRPGISTSIYKDLEFDQLYIWDADTADYKKSSIDEARIAQIETNLSNEETERKDDIADLIENMLDRDSLLNDQIIAEANIRSNQDTVLYDKINTETTNREDADDYLLGQITAETTARTNANNLKLDKPTTTITDTTNRWAVLVDNLGNSFKVLAGDLGKNIANSKLVSVLNAGLDFGANWQIDTKGYLFKILGLVNKSADSTFNQFLVRNSNGDIAQGNGKSLAISMPYFMTTAEKNRWFADMNSETSFSGTSVIVVIPPVIERSALAQNIVIKGLGLNLVTNFEATPELNKSYVGLFPDLNNNGTQQGNEIDMPAINYSRVGDNQTIIAQFLLDDNVPLGKYKVKIKNAGIPAIGDAYVNIVSNLINIPFELGEIRLLQGTSLLNTTDEIRASLSIDENIKPKVAVLNSLTDPIVNWVDGNILNGTDDWWFVYQIENSTTNYYATGSFIARMGLASANNAGFIYPDTGIISVYNFSSGQTFQQNSSARIEGAGELYQTGNLAQINYIKTGNILTTMLIGTNGVTIILTSTIDTTKNYRLVALLNNSGYRSGAMDLIVNKLKLSKLN